MCEKPRHTHSAEGKLALRGAKTTRHVVSEFFSGDFISLQVMKPFV